MLKNRFLSIFAVAGLAMLAACGGDEVDAEAELGEGGVVTDTLIERGTETVPVVAEVPTADTAIVVTDRDVQVDVDRDTVPLEERRP
ncbi:MAG TPA: hypothetical protein VGR37_21495 [Longimicrobiaceae bacterium]|nr:hypothetical protein [Longimicrobiaceae bacterium]